MGIRRVNAMDFLSASVENDGPWFVNYEHQLPIELTTANVNPKMTTWEVIIFAKYGYPRFFLSRVRLLGRHCAKGKVRACMGVI